MTASVANSVVGPTLLQVGERSPTDKKYQTREVLLAPPGTVVAPMPKGMEPTEENGLALILAHLFKNAKAQSMQGMKAGGRVMRGAAWGEDVGSPGPTGTGTAVPNLPIGTQSGAGLATGTQFYTSPYDPGAILTAQSNDASTAANYRLGKDQNELNRLTAYQNYTMALNKMEYDREAAAKALELQKQQLSAQSIADSYNRASMNSSVSQQASQQKAALDNALAIAQLQVAAQRAIAEMQNQLGYAGLAEQTRQDTMANQIAQGQLANQSAQDEFNRIMSGVSEASVKRAGPAVPSTGIYS